MKAVYKVRAADRVMELIMKAKSENRTIDYIMVTPGEHDDLLMTCRLNDLGYRSNPYQADASVGTIELKNPSFVANAHNSYVRFPRNGWTRLFNVELVIVPEQYHSWKVVG